MIRRPRQRSPPHPLGARRGSLPSWGGIPFPGQGLTAHPVVQARRYRAPDHQGEPDEHLRQTAGTAAFRRPAPGAARPARRGRRGALSGAGFRLRQPRHVPAGGGTRDRAPGDHRSREAGPVRPSVRKRPGTSHRHRARQAGGYRLRRQHGLRPPTSPTTAREPSPRSALPPTRQASRSGSGASPARSRSPRTARPPTSPTTAREPSPRSAPPPTQRASRSGSDCIPARSRSPRTARPPTSPATARPTCPARQE